MRRVDAPRVAGVAVSDRLRAALTTAPVDDRAMRGELVRLAERLSAGADERSIAIADDLVTLVARALAEAPVANGAFALRVFALCTSYFDGIGRLDVPLRLACRIGACATAWPDPRRRRSAHQFAAVVHLRAGDAREAWSHAERAYDCASGFETSAERFETLVLVVSILDDLGLQGDAKTLALQLLDFPDVDPALDTLHLVNAVNGLSLCHRLDDLVGGTRFQTFAAAKAATRAAGGLDPIGARFEAASALHLVRLGSARAAARRLDVALARLSKADGPRVEALLRTAQADVYAVLDDRVRMATSLEALKRLLPVFHPASAFHRELLRTIIRLQLRRPGGDTVVAMRYLELLRERPSDVTAGSAGCIDVLLHSLVGGIVDDVTVPSTEPDPGRFQEVGTRDWAKDPWRGRRFADFRFEARDDGGDAAVVTLPEREASLRTPAFVAAENWAVVAEIAIGGDGRQCFKVGRIAAGLAAAIGLSDERTMLIELACRLRNLGDATLGPVSPRSKTLSADRSAIVAERTQAGARILSFSADPVLRSAARIAMTVRAAWNGDGVPGGLRGPAIPVEARICAVADHLVSLVDPIGGRNPWPIEAAVRQLRSMAGVQLDPELVGVLDRVLHDEGTRVEDAALRLNALSWADPLAKARKQMIETLELAN